MKKISLLSFILFFIPHFCIAGPINVVVDFWDSAPYVLDGHIVFGAETDSNGKVIGLSEGTIEFGGNKFDFNPISLYFTDYTSQNWDYIIGNLRGSYQNAGGVETFAWAHYEGVATNFYNGGVLDAESFVYVDENANPPKWRHASLSVVDVPEPASFALILVGFIGLAITRRFGARH